MTIGSWPEVSVQDAINEAVQARSLVRSGTDPRAVKLEERAEEIRTALTDSTRIPAKYRLSNLISRFREYWPTTGKSQRTLEKYCSDLELYLRDPGGVDIRTITAPTWERRILKLANVDGKKGAAGNLHKAGRRILGFAVREGLLEHNPLAAMFDAVQATRLDPDDRFLESGEIHKFLNELEDQKVATWVKQYLSVMLRAGGRVEEWARIRISWVKFERRRIELPAAAMKNRRKAWIHLTEPAVEILLERLQDLKSQHGRISPEWFLFGDPADPSKENPNDLSHFTRNLRAWISFSPKVIRKTISTQLQRKGCPPAVLRAIRNQVITQGVESHYDFDDLFHLKKDWLETWGELLEAVREDPEALVPEKESRLSGRHKKRVKDLFRD